MISVIVCSKQPASWDFHQRNVDKTIGSEYEYIRIDNTSNSFGICAAYNKGVQQSKGEILVFVHEDCFFMEVGWGNVVCKKFKADNKIGLIGVAGTQYLFENNPFWVAAGQPFAKGRVVHQDKKGTSIILTVFSWDKEDAEVVAVDGLFFAIKRELFNRIKFDENTFSGFHFYDLDISMQVRKTHKLIVTWDILVKHFSGGNTNQEWHAAGKKFLEKYKNELPASCASKKPDPNNRIPFYSYNITDKVDNGVII
jgi:hypothetical protein